VPQWRQRDAPSKTASLLFQRRLTTDQVQRLERLAGDMPPDSLLVTDNAGELGQKESSLRVYSK
jgi:hypothetical protein